MASLPEDDGPTMSGLPEGRRVDVATDGDSDDTTSADLGLPAPQEGPPAHDEEDRTVQQKVSPPQRARKPVTSPAPDPPRVARLKTPTPAPISTSSPKPPSRPASSAAATLSSPIPSVAMPSTEPAGAPSPLTTLSATASEARDVTEDLEDDLGDDDEPLEDSITATAPRINAPLLPLTVPAAVDIRHVVDEEMNDETEVRTRPGNVPLDIPATLRAAPAPPEPLPAPRPAAGRPPSMLPETAVSPGNDDDGDPHDDGVTTQAAAPRLGSVPDFGAPTLARPSSVASTPASEIASTERPSVRLPLSTATDVAEELMTQPGVGSGGDGDDEPMTAPGVESTEGADDPPTRPGVEPPTSPGLGDPETRPRLSADSAVEAETSKRIIDPNSYANEDDELDENMTTTARGRAVKEYADDSVTTQAPNVPPSLVAAVIAGADALLDDGTDGTTQRVKKKVAALDSPADDEAESITTQAPDGLTNILRVMASGSSPDLDDVPPIEDDEGPENRTAVMANAPLKKVLRDLDSASALPAIRPTGGPLSHRPQGAAVPHLEPSSESGLRVARGSGSGERASLGLGAAADARNSGIVGTDNALASDGSISAPIDARALANTEMAFPNGQPSLHDVDLTSGGPRYGLLVAIVAVVSIIVPVTLFAVLRKGSDTVTPAVASEVVSEIEAHDPPRAKKPAKGSAAAAAAAAAAASASASASAQKPVVPPPGRFPFRR